jgi:hypothetical protein
LEAAGLALDGGSQVREKQLRRIYRRRLAQLLRRRPDPAVWRVYAIKCAMHYHTHRLVDALQRRSLNVLNTF